jgi:signal transduction histidine kinase
VLNQKTLSNLLAPRMHDDTSRRKEFIVNILLLGSLSLSFLVLLLLALRAASLGNAYHGVPLIQMSGVCLFFLSLFLLSRARQAAIAAGIFIALYFGIATASLAQWGFTLPVGLLLYCLVIVMTGILISSRSAFRMAILCSSVLVLLAYRPVSGMSHPDIEWLHQPFNLTDTVSFIFTFLLIASVSWLSNREIENSLQRAIASEQALTLERDQLEIKVEERTSELTRSQLERTLQLTRFANFGRRATGLFHDLVNPLTTVSLNLQRLEGMGESSELIGRAIEATKRMEQFLELARQDIRNQRDHSIFLPAEEISKVVRALSDELQEEKITIEFKGNTTIDTYGSAGKFQQIITNLLMNAIDAYRDGKPSRRRIVVSLTSEKEMILVGVQDWAVGIDPAAQKQIFEPFFTSKESTKNTGMGLAICREIVEKDFLGTITAEGAIGDYALFRVEFPRNAL